MFCIFAAMKKIFDNEVFEMFFMRDGFGFGLSRMRKAGR